MSVFKLSPLEIQASLEYWTPARIADATPFPLPRVEIPEKSQQKDDKFSKAEAEMSFCNAEYSRGRTRLMTLNNKILKRTGRLYYTRPNGEFGWATAQVVGRDDILMTVAHCLKEPGLNGKLSNNLVFLRSFANEKHVQNMPIAISSIHVNPCWNTDILREEDRIKWNYGFVKTTCACTDGYYELGLDLPDKVKSIGYSDIYQYKYLCYVNGKSGKALRGRVCMQTNFMGEGAYGGAWLLLTGGNQIFGLNAQSNTYGKMFGPVFDQETQHTLNKLMRGTNYRKRIFSDPYGFQNKYTKYG